MSHSPEPWRTSSPRFIRCADGVGYVVADACCPEDADRIVACVNACRGIPTDELTQHGVISGKPGVAARGLLADAQSIADRLNDPLAPNPGWPSGICTDPDYDVTKPLLDLGDFQ